MNWGYNRATISLISREIRVFDIKIWYKNISKVRNVVDF